MNNPKIVLDQIVNSNSDEKVVSILPLTISRYAYLELIDSPFLNPEKKFSALNVVASAYIMTQSNKVLKKYSASNLDDLTSDAFDWADENLELSDMGNLITAIIEQINKLNKVAPSGGDSTEVGEDASGKKK